MMWQGMAWYVMVGRDLPDFLRRLSTEAEPFSAFTTFSTSIMKFSAMLSFTWGRGEDRVRTGKDRSKKERVQSYMGRIRTKDRLNMETHLQGSDLVLVDDDHADVGDDEAGAQPDGGDLGGSVG